MSDTSLNRILRGLLKLVDQESGATRTFMLEDRKVATASFIEKGPLIKIEFHTLEHKEVKMYDDLDEATIEIYSAIRNLR